MKTDYPNLCFDQNEPEMREKLKERTNKEAKAELNENIMEERRGSYMRCSGNRFTDEKPQPR